jgi:uncharacterized protein (TIGR00661 family)
VTRVLYGFSGEGSGHSSRAREMIAGLRERGHEVLGASYGRGYANLKDGFELVEIEGLSLASVDNRVSARRTVAENLAKLEAGVAGWRRLRQAFKELAPEVVITDFEPLSAHLAQHYKLPLVTLDNQHRMRYMRYPCPPELRRDALVTEAVIRAFVPRPDVSLVTTFWFGEVKNARTFLFPPILRREVLALAPRDDGHVLVYFTHGFESFLERLAALRGERFLVYGTGRTGREGNLEHRAPSRDGFLDALAGAKAVVATAGFTLMTEALHLGKPYLALPMAGQFEQELNALLLADAGYGLNGRAGRADMLAEFLARLPEYRARLAAYPRGDNSAIEGMLERLLAGGGALARAFHAHRRGGPPPAL